MLLRFLSCTAVITLAMTGIGAAQQNLPAATQQTATPLTDLAECWFDVRFVPQADVVA